MADEIFVKCKVTEFKVRVEYVVDFGIQRCRNGVSRAFVRSTTFNLS